MRFFIGGAMSLASASIVTIDLSDRLTTKRQIDFLASGTDGVNFYATASSGNSMSWVNQSGAGLGVSSYLLEPNRQIDGLGRDDMLRLTFETPVTLLSATFSGIDSRDGFVLLDDKFNYLFGGDISRNSWYVFPGFTGRFSLLRSKTETMITIYPRSRLKPGRCRCRGRQRCFFRG